MKKILIWFISTLVLMAVIFPAKTFAQEVSTITVSNTSAKPGETAEMVVSVETDSGISGAGLTVFYNTSALTLTDIRPLTSGTFLGDVERDSFSWLKGKNLSGSFELAVLCFSIDESANGDYTVTVAPIGDLSANITNENALPVAATFVPGILSIAKEVTGEVDSPSTDEPDTPAKETPDVPATAPPEAPDIEDSNPDSTIEAEDAPAKTPEIENEQKPGTSEEENPQPSQPDTTSPAEKPAKERGNIGVYVAVIAAAVVGFVAGTVRKKRK